MSEAYYLWPVPGTSFPPEALDEWRKFLDAQLTVPREDGVYCWFADAAVANGFRQSGSKHTEYADLIALKHDGIEIDASYVHEEPALAALRNFLSRFKAQWPYTLSGPGKDDMTVDEFVDEYRTVAG
jgi:hypothetical protein